MRGGTASTKWTVSKEGTNTGLYPHVHVQPHSNVQLHTCAHMHSVPMHAYLSTLNVSFHKLKRSWSWLGSWDAEGLSWALSTHTSGLTTTLPQASGASHSSAFHRHLQSCTHICTHTHSFPEEDGHCSPCEQQTSICTLFYLLVPLDRKNVFSFPGRVVWPRHSQNFMEDQACHPGPAFPGETSILSANVNGFVAIPSSFV